MQPFDVSAQQVFPLMTPAMHIPSRVEEKFVTYVADDDLVPVGDEGWSIYGVIVLSGLSGVFLRRTVTRIDPPTVSL